MCSARCTFAALGLLVIAVGGCSSESYKIETRIGSDGAIDRAVCQPARSVPETADGVHAGWQQVRVVGRPTDEIAIRQMKPVKVSDKKLKADQYFAGWGRFAKFSDIPDHFVMSAEKLDRQGRLVRDYRRRDLGLVIEHVWRETLTDVVELDDRLRARDEWVTLLIDVTIATLEHRFGKEYRFGLLESWARTTAAAFVADVLEVDMEFAIQRRALNEKELEARMIPIMARHGLKVAGPDGRLLKEIPEKDFEKRIFIPFIHSLLKQHIRDAEGKPPGEEVIKEIMVWLPLVDAGEKPEPPAMGDGPKPPTPLEVSWQTVINKRFGSEEVFVAQTHRLTTRIWGLYRQPFMIFGTSRNFDVSLQLPGEVVETTGTISGAGEVVWRFEAGQAFPAGYQMSCRSLEVRQEAAALLIKLKPGDRRKVLLKLVGLIKSDDDPLLAVLRASAAKKSWSPLEVYRRGLDRKEQADEVMRLDGLYRLLQLPLTGSGRAPT